MKARPASFVLDRQRLVIEGIDFVVNGEVVHTEPKSGAMAKTDGIYGIRVNHLLEVHVDGLAVSK